MPLAPSQPSCYCGFCESNAQNNSGISLLAISKGRADFAQTCWVGWVQFSEVWSLFFFSWQHWKNACRDFSPQLKQTISPPWCYLLPHHSLAARRCCYCPARVACINHAASQPAQATAASLAPVPAAFWTCLLLHWTCRTAGAECRSGRKCLPSPSTLWLQTRCVESCSDKPPSPGCVSGAVAAVGWLAATSLSSVHFTHKQEQWSARTCLLRGSALFVCP